jgi:two-component system, OmpR family, sensor histidine kinase ArlS
MPVRLRITLLFSMLVFVILSLVCLGIYYFSYQERLDSIKTRLRNRAITTSKLLSQKEVFTQQLVQRIDSSTTLSLKDKTVEAYNDHDSLVYWYTEVPQYSLHLTKDQLRNARERGNYYFQTSNREVVAYYQTEYGRRIVVAVAAEDVEGKENLRSLINILALIFIVSNVIVVITGYYFSKGLVAPIKKISEEVKEISAQDLTRRIKTNDTKDEWNELSKTFNDLLSRLQQSFEMQRRFVANASHELSTPLTAISSQMQVTLSRKRNGAEYERVMQSVYEDVKQLGKLIHTLLSFAKASGDAGGLEINLVRLDELLLQLPSELSRMNAAYVVKLDLKNLPENQDALLVFGNETLLSTAIRNIVLNACKYSRDHVAVVRLTVRDEWVIVEVEDKGEGIHKEEQEHIFQPFHRLDSARAEEGFGLGLSLSQQIAKIHKGRIEVDSALGKGSTFFIILPAASSLTFKL